MIQASASHDLAASMHCHPPCWFNIRCGCLFLFHEMRLPLRLHSGAGKTA